MKENVNEFQGDCLLTSTINGFDLVFKEGLIQDCRNFDTAAALSLFGGNENDLNGKEKETWWGNLVEGTKKDEWIHSEFKAIARALPLTSGNLKKAQAAAERDLSWIKDAGADSIKVQLSAANPERVKLRAEVWQEDKNVGQCEFETQWAEAVR